MIPTVDIVIPTCNRGNLIEATIASIRACQGVTLTLWVVDQSQDDRTKQVVMQHAQADPRVRYMHTAARGISAARNAGVAAGCAPLVLFTDDDCRVDPDWARQMAQALDSPGVWAVFGRVLPDRTDHPLVHGVTPGIALGVKLSNQPERYAANRFNLGFGHGASMGVQRTRLEQLGGFDEFLGVGGPLRSWEDRDLGYRILAAGGIILYHPSALLYHRQWRDWGSVWRATHNYGLGTGAVAGKYLRCGDAGGLVLLGEWLLDQGVRQIFSGIFKWHSYQKVAVGFQQMITPWIGLAHGMRYPIDRQYRIYRCKRK